MKKRQSENYIFNFDDDYIERNIEKIIEIQENCFKYICKVLKVRYEDKIEYYLCKSPQQVGEIYGDNDPCNGFASFPNKIYAVYNEKTQCIGPHEDSHIIAYNTLGNPPNVFIKEGLAMYFDKTWWGISNLAWVTYYYNKNKLPKFNNIVTNSGFFNYSCELTYPIVGALTEYIISIYGIEQYIEFFKNLDENFHECFNKYFGISITEIERDFLSYVSSSQISDNIFNLIEKMLNNKN